jgi:hypothetical protein
MATFFWSNRPLSHCFSFRSEFAPACDRKNSSRPFPYDSISFTGNSVTNKRRFFLNFVLTQYRKKWHNKKTLIRREELPTASPASFSSKYDPMRDLNQRLSLSDRSVTRGSAQPISAGITTGTGSAAVILRRIKTLI